MNILITPHAYYGCVTPCGGEVFLHRLVTRLKEYGHQVKCIAYCDEPYIFEGIEVYPQFTMENIWVKNNELFQWCDVVFTQLQGSAYGYNKSNQHNKPLFFISHNHFKSYPTNTKTRIIYNSYYMQSLNLYPDTVSTVLHPLIPNPSVMGERKYIALINCNENKGAMLFNELAESMPYQFLGIKGAYGAQILSDSVTYMENTRNVDWSEIKLLLVPSELESWSQVASEAIAHGIPVICTPLDGLKENLSYAGIYIDKENVNSYKETIRWLMESESIYQKQSELCLKRASEYNNNLDGFNNWLIENSK